MGAKSALMNDECSGPQYIKLEPLPVLRAEAGIATSISSCWPWQIDGRTPLNVSRGLAWRQSRGDCRRTSRGSRRLAYDADGGTFRTSPPVQIVIRDTLTGFEPLPTPGPV